MRNGFPKSFDYHIKKLKIKKIINHKDFTNIPFVTIDGQDSKDFDDAVWSETIQGITNIMVAISDVSFFIEKNDPLDLEAKKKVIHFIFLIELFQCFPMKFQMTYARLFQIKKEHQ